MSCKKEDKKLSFSKCQYRLQLSIPIQALHGKYSELFSLILSQFSIKSLSVRIFWNFIGKANLMYPLCCSGELIIKKRRKSGDIIFWYKLRYHRSAKPKTTPTGSVTNEICSMLSLTFWWPNERWCIPCLLEKIPQYKVSLDKVHIVDRYNENC